MKKILIVDDEPLIRKSLEKVFSGQNYKIFLAEDGLKGLGLWRTEKPDLVFLDVLMPGLSGVQVLKEIGTEKSGKVVLMSAYSGEYNLEKAQSIGADLFLSKPFEDIFSLIGIAEKLLKEK